MELKQKIEQFIKNKNVCVIATCSENKPRASTVNYVPVGFTLYVVTSSKSTKYKNIKENPNISVAIDNQGRACLQAEGIVKILKGLQAKQARKFYSQKRDISHHKPELVDTILKINLKKIMFSEYLKEGLKVYRIEV
ncbi:hypothetical protein A3K72_00885 [Candidatus Woesearchaeota archaeon RBG_13_36_6]|nr:MAG: hypothetical protein A3K72_00885 [Candidatus Woesearchaeota archaeon RBG_13_36_6]